MVLYIKINLLRRSFNSVLKSFVHGNCPKMPPKKQPKIIIVGAGASGIAAATRLIENGLNDVTVLEAENRIGGRIHSVDFGGSVVDSGATWVHGEKDNVVFDMVKNLDLISRSHNDYEDNTFYMSNGVVANKNLTDHLYKIATHVLADEDCAKQHPGPFGQYFNRVYNERVQAEYKNNPEALELAKLIEAWFEKMFLCLDSALSWNDMSTTGVHRFDKCDGYQQWNWRDKGYRTILYVMMKKIPDITKQLPVDDKVFINKEVNRITWSKNDLNPGGVTVNCSDGSFYNADHVILTMSVGVLKSTYKNLFTPELPEEKINSIEGISLGTVNKIFLRFQKKWWPDDLKGFSLLWTDEDRQKLREEFPRGPVTEGKSWLEDIFGFYVLDSHPRVLLGWVVGRTALDIEKMGENEVIDGCMFLLEKFIGRKYKISKPEAVLRTMWNTNPHFRGSYVHVSSEMERRNANAQDLAKPLVSSESAAQTVLFAGEATHPTRYSTVHGAIETGYREAERLTKIYCSA